MTQKPTMPPTNTRYGSSLNSRFGSSNVSWDIVSITGTIVCFDLNGLGEPLHQLLGLKSSSEHNDREAAIRAIEDGDASLTALTEKLDAAWEGYALHGAALVYPWREELRQAIRPRLEGDMELAGQPTYLRALDPLFVLNILARARSQILLATSPPDLERPFLERSLAADDSRLVALARLTGCREEHANALPPELAAE